MSRVHIYLVALSLSVYAALAAPKPKDPPKPAPAGLIGQWKFESSSIMVAPRPRIDQFLTLTADGKTESRIGDKVVGTGTYTFDPKKAPAELDLTDAGPLGRPWPGIYSLDGDTLTFCVSADQSRRPTSFDPTESPGVIRTVYKRVTAKD